MQAARMFNSLTKHVGGGLALLSAGTLLLATNNSIMQSRFQDQCRDANISWEMQRMACVFANEYDQKLTLGNFVPRTAYASVAP